MRRAFSILFALLGAFATASAISSPAMAGVTVAVDLSSQTMTVSEDGAVRNRWNISSGRDGYRTPNGSYRPQRLVRMHYSRKYNMAPMPHSIFFRGGFAIHGTGETGRLGRTASHGCIRLAPGNAAELFRLVQSRADTRIVITGSAAVADSGRRAAPRRAYTAAPREERAAYRGYRSRPVYDDYDDDQPRYYRGPVYAPQVWY